MAIIYVRSTDGSDADNGSTWALAKATLAGAFAIAAAGDTIYVSHVHAETQASNMSLASPGTAASPCRVICVNDGAAPPTTLATTATISTTGNSDITYYAFAYYYGITFNASGAANNTGKHKLVPSSGAQFLWFDSCALKCNGTNSDTYIQIGPLTGTNPVGQGVVFNNTYVSFANTASTIYCAGRIRWMNTASATQGTVPTVLFTPATLSDAAEIECSGLDLSAFSGSLVNVGIHVHARVKLNNCRLHASVAATTGTSASPGAPIVELTNCASGATNYNYRKSYYAGDVYHETTIVRTDGATDGTTPVSRKMVSSANTKYFYPLEGDPIYFWCDRLASTTVSVETVTDNVTLKDDEAWIEVEYLGSASYPISSFASDRTAGILTTGTNQTTSTEAWTTTGLTTPVYQTLSTTFTPAMKGLFRAVVKLAKASTTMYYDPRVLSSSSRQLMVGG